MSVRVIIGDCRTILPTLQSADVVITDPVWPNVPDGLLQGWDRPRELLAEMCAALPCSVKRLVIVLRSDCDPRFLQAVPDRWPFFNASWMQYAMPGYIGRKLGAIVIPSVAPKAQPRDRLANGHPCSRALVHMEWLVKWWSIPGEMIVDPFAGSGTVGVAAVTQGREAVCIEIEPAYCELARNRIAEAERSPRFAEVRAA